VIDRPDTRSRWRHTRVTRFALLMILVLFVLLQGSTGPAQTPHTVGGYDTTWVLCCGQDIDGKYFCTNRMREECQGIGGKEVASCEKCRKAREYTP